MSHQSSDFPNLKLEVAVSHSDWPMGREKSSHGKVEVSKPLLCGSVGWNDSAEPLFPPALLYLLQHLGRRRVACRRVIGSRWRVQPQFLTTP